MVAPYRHEGDFAELTTRRRSRSTGWRDGDRRARAGLWRRRASTSAGTSGGSRAPGIVDHVHLHVVPRWAGDTNFMPVLADVKVMPEALEATRRKLAEAWP